MVDPPPLFSYYHQHQFLTYFSIQVKCIVSFFFNEYRIDSEVRRDWIVRSSIRDRIYLLYSTKKKGNSLDKLRNHFRSGERFSEMTNFVPTRLELKKLQRWRCTMRKFFSSHSRYCSWDAASSRCSNGTELNINAFSQRRGGEGGEEGRLNECKRLIRR